MKPYNKLIIVSKTDDILDTSKKATLEAVADDCDAYLKELLSDCADKLILPEAASHSNPSWFGFLMTCKEGVDRTKVVNYIESHGVQTRMLFSGNLIKHPCFDDIRGTEAYRVVGGLEQTDRIMTSTFWVGVYPGMTDEKIEYMAKVIHEALEG